MNYKIIISYILLSISFISKCDIPKDAKIYVCGHRGLVGSALMRILKKEGFTNIVTRTSQELDLRRQLNVEQFFEQERPEYVFVSAGKVGGIMANKNAPADFLYDNVMIAANVIHAAYEYGAKKILYLGSSCIYPKMCEQPITEESLLSGILEPTNEGYALAKIMGLRMCAFFNKQYGTKFISCMPTNLYGPNDNFNLKTSHVLPALIHRMYEAKEREDKDIVVWGTGNAKREFLHVDDLASACLFLMNNYEDDLHINIGCGEDISIKDLVSIIKDMVEFEGDIMFDTSKPDGAPRKLLNIKKIRKLGWVPKIKLKEGIGSTLKWYLKNKTRIRK